MDKKKVWIVGHKNPDTDSICAAIAYADLKNKSDHTVTYIPKRTGEINAETAYVLSYFGVDKPEYIEDVGTQVQDITYRKTEGVSSHISMKKAWEMMKELKVATLPVVNAKNKLEGIIVTSDIAKSYMDVYDNAALSTAKTQYKNIVETLEGKIIVGNEHGYFVNGKVVVATGSAQVNAEILEQDDMVIVGDNEENQVVAMEAGCSCLIVSDGLKVSEHVKKMAEMKQVFLINTPYDTFTVSRLINQSMPIKYFMTKEHIISFDMDDYVDEVKDVTIKIRHRDFPILDENQNYIGMFSRRNLLNAQKKQLILVDHNEKSQAVNNIEEAEILEIIDHHRLGSLETISPVYFRNQPLGCTSTIIYQIYQEKAVVVDEKIAGLLCAAILSDTLMFRSPTCTEVDRQAAEELAKIANVDIEEFATKMFEAGSNFDTKTEEEILNQDFKIFYSGEVSFGVSQVSAMSKTELDKVKHRIENKLAAMCDEKRVDMLFVMLTDILNETTYLLFCGSDALNLVKEAFHCTPENSEVELAGVVSRKKQLIPPLMNALVER